MPSCTILGSQGPFPTPSHGCRVTHTQPSPVTYSCWQQTSQSQVCYAVGLTNFPMKRIFWELVEYITNKNGRLKVR